MLRCILASRDAIVDSISIFMLLVLSLSECDAKQSLHCVVNQV